MATNPFEKYIANDFADFVGLRITGTLPVKQEILNDLLQTVLKDLQQAPATPSVPASKETSSAVDPRSLLKHVKRAELRAEAGRLVLDFDVSVDAPDQ